MFVQYRSFIQNMSFQRHGNWISNAPVAFQRFDNLYHISEDSVTMQCASCSDVYDFRNQSKRQVQPVISLNRSCTVLLAENLAEPEWVSVNCWHKLLRNTVCFVSRNHSKESQGDMQAKGKRLFCPHLFLLTGEHCYIFKWHWSSDPVPEKISSFSLKLANQMHINNLKDISSTTKAPFPVLLCCRQADKLHDVVKTRQTGMNTTGLLVYSSAAVNFSAGGNIFECAESNLISHIYVCDRKNNCPKRDTRDEDPEVCGLFLNSTTKLRRFLNLDTKDHLPQSTAIDGDASERLVMRTDITNGSSNLKPDSSHKFLCHNEKELEMSLVNDLVGDCGPGAEDEDLLKSVLIAESTVDVGGHNQLNFSGGSQCANPADLPCRTGHRKCFPIHEICVFRITKNKNLSPCRNGGHLEECSSFSCNAMFKCAHSYCVPCSLT